MKHQSSLSLKLSFTILGVVLLIFAVIIFYNFKISQHLLIEGAKNQAKSTTSLTISQIEDALNSVENTSNLVAGYISQNSINKPDIEKVLKILANNSQQILSSFVMLDATTAGSNFDDYYYFFNKDENGIAQTYKGSADAAAKDWIKRILVKNEPFWSEPYLNQKSGEMASAYLVPAYFSDANHALVKGLVGIELRLKWLQDLISSKKIYKSDYIFILSKEGKPVIMPNNSFSYDTDIYALAKKLNNPKLLQLCEKLKNGESGSSEGPGLLTDFESVIYFSPVPSTKWSVGVVFPKSELYSNLYFTTAKIAAAGLLGFMLIFFTTLFILKRLTKPLRELSLAAENIGQGNFEVEMPDINTNDEVGVLKNSLQTMQHELQTYIENLVKTEKEKEHIESELQIAKSIQMGYLRKDFELFSADKDIEIAALLRPAREVGGDFYDYFLIDENTLCVAIGDVAGKGVSAALLMTIVLSLTRSGNFSSEQLKTVVSKINNTLCRHNENSMFTTFFIGLLNLQNRELTFCNAGHTFPYLVRNGDLFEVRGNHGIALGLFEDQVFKTGKLMLNTGDSIILFTDGITDAENKNGEFFGKTRLEDALLLSKDKPAIEITNSIYRQVKQFAGGHLQTDDLALLAFRIKGKQNITD